MLSPVIPPCVLRCQIGQSLLILINTQRTHNLLKLFKPTCDTALRAAMPDWAVPVKPTHFRPAVSSEKTARVTGNKGKDACAVHEMACVWCNDTPFVTLAQTSHVCAHTLMHVRNTLLSATFFSVTHLAALP